jgi:hypothetical protein
MSQLCCGASKPATSGESSGARAKKVVYRDNQLSANHFKVA